MALGRPKEIEQVGLSPRLIASVVLSVVWIIGSTLYLVFARTAEGMEDRALRFVLSLVAIFLPVALFWATLYAASTMRSARLQSQRLVQALDDLSKTVDRQSGMIDRLVARGGDFSGERKALPDQAPRPAAKAHKAAQVQPVPRVASESEGDNSGVEQQIGLDLGLAAEPEAANLTLEELIGALHFPANASDKEGFRALRRALKDRHFGGLILACQDILTLLSQDGIYMDDLQTDRSRPDLWRRFAKGERGRAVSALGGIRDRSTLAAITQRMRSDTIFRDAAHHFLRKFDTMLAQIADDASDLLLTRLAETRSARAFMLLGRVAGTFD